MARRLQDQHSTVLLIGEPDGSAVAVFGDLVVGHLGEGPQEKVVECARAKLCRRILGGGGEGPLGPALTAENVPSTKVCDLCLQREFCEGLSSSGFPWR